MLKTIKEKAEYFNRCNLFYISENISDLGLELDKDNIDLLTEKSISNSMKGYSYLKAIDINDKILSIQPNNLSAKLNKINNISNLSLKELDKKYIDYLIKNISETMVIDGDSKIVIGRAIDVLTELIEKYNDQIYDLFKDKYSNIIFPKLRLLYFSFHVNELQYNSLELLKVFFIFFSAQST